MERTTSLPSRFAGLLRQSSSRKVETVSASGGLASVRPAVHSGSDSSTSGSGGYGKDLLRSMSDMWARLRDREQGGHGGRNSSPSVGAVLRVVEGKLVYDKPPSATAKGGVGTTAAGKRPSLPVIRSSANLLVDVLDIAPEEDEGEEGVIESCDSL
ncbi:hypothetical protein GPECTOR_17g858 [Gonium pectorale]|uniref:Uncharacterized protein n=1 Tax=Gonium pectorale TaxID=33097 RepID=A0A150GKB1_GONPE|nr:hypothetical protein GPECTOR_17g858 [Gonium pectorale]|eukprot:KXZ50221.1 hypothetical protein GPECTOR_17g858 [Gonium pectorale]